MAEPQTPQPLAGQQQTGRPVVEYPSPVTGVGPGDSDVILVETVDTLAGDYTALAYGDSYPDQTAYPGLKLTFQQPIDSKYAKRVWAADRGGQDAYNMALSYLQESSTNTIYVRSYILPLDQAETPILQGTPDPVDGAAFLTHQETKGLGEEVDPQIAMVYRLVIRVYETRPGPTLTLDKRGDIRDLPALLLAVNEIKTQTTEEILPQTPDTLTATVLQSTVIPETVIAGKKENVVGPNSWTPSVESIVNDSTWGTAGTITITAAATETVDTGILVLDSDVKTIGGLQVKTTEAVTAWPTLAGDTYDVPEFRDPRFLQHEDIALTRTKVAAGTAADHVTDPGSESTVTPETSTRSQKDTKDRTATYGTTLIGAVVSEATQMQAGVLTETQGTSLSADVGLLVVSSEIKPLGGGQQLRSTVTVASWGSLVSEYQDEGNATVTETRVKVAAGSVTPSDSVTSTIWTVVKEEAIDTEKSWQVTTARDLSQENAIFIEEKTDVDGFKITVTKVLSIAGTEIIEDVIAGSQWVRSSSSAYPGTNSVLWVIQEARDVPGVPIPSIDYDEQGNEVTVTKTLVVAPAAVQAPTISGSTWSEVTEEPDSRSIVVCWQVSRSYTNPGNTVSGAAQWDSGVAGSLTVEKVPAGTSADTGADVIESVLKPLDNAASEKTTRTGVLWDSTGNVADEATFGLSSSMAAAISSSSTISTGINIVSSRAVPDGPLRFRVETITAPFDSTTANAKRYNDRGEAVEMTRTWVAPDSSLGTQTATSEELRQWESDFRARKDVLATTRVTLKSYKADQEAQGETTVMSSAIITATAGDPGTIVGAFGTLQAERRTNEAGQSEQIIRKIPDVVATPFPVLTDYEWDDFAQAFIKVHKQIVEAGTTTPGITSGVLTEVKPYDKFHELKIVSQYNTSPADQTIPILVEVSTPDWFTSGPTQEDATSGYTTERGESYATKKKHGHFTAVLTRKFSNAIASAPSGTALKFTPVASRTGTPYFNIGTEPYCKILYYDIPENIGTEPTGDFLVGVQSQPHRMKWVQEYITVTI